MRKLEREKLKRQELKQRANETLVQLQETEELDQALFLYNVSNMLTVKEVLDILDDSDHLDDAKTLIRETVS